MTKEAQTLLLQVARDSIASAFHKGTGEPLRVARMDKALTVVGPGAFVTLHEHGRLRGCIGYLVGAGNPLCDLVSLLAKESAFKDWRFPPLEEKELEGCTIEISVLTVPKPIRSLEAFLPGRDGIILTALGRRAVFLPQVATEQGWGRQEMLENLSRKAGLLPDGYLDPGARYETFQAEVFGEQR